MFDFPTSVIQQIAHRPWPMPDAPWVMTQSWHDLLFAHWPVDAELLQSKLPSAFTLDLFDGHAWIAVVPFRMTNVGPRGASSIPWVSTFAEVNVRTYVTVGGRPGVYFFSLDAESSLAVAAARSLLNLPYYAAQMDVREDAGQIHYSSRRVGDDASPAQLIARYRPAVAATQPRPSTLEYFLTERYCLYNVDARSRAYRLEIHHPPWTLHQAEAEFELNTMTAAAGIPLPPVAPLLHFAKRQDMVAWVPETLQSV